MTRFPPSSEDVFDDGLDPEGPSEADLDRFGDEQVRCWNCHAHYYDQLEHCPHCGSAHRKPGAGMPTWMWALAAAGVVGFLFVFVF